MADDDVVDDEAEEDRLDRLSVEQRQGYAIPVEQVKAWLDNLDVDPADARDGRHMRRIAAAAAALTIAEADLATAVADARAAGDTWAMIGIALGVSRHAAEERYGRD